DLRAFPPRRSSELDAALRDASELLQVGTHFTGAEGSVDADGKRLGVSDRVVERADRLAGERAAGRVGDRHADHYRHALSCFLEYLLCRKQRRLRVERV